ncbi:unnamed protein product [Prunus brigantina]
MEKCWIVAFTLLTSNQPIDLPSKEPPLGLGMFQIDITFFDFFPWMGFVTCMKIFEGLGPTPTSQA